MSRRIFRTLPTITLLVLALFVPPAEAQGPMPPASPVAVMPVVEKDIGATQVFPGTVLPARTSNVGSAVDGRVVEYPVREGDYIRKGETIAQLLTGLLEIEKAAATAQLHVYEAKLKEMQQTRPEEIEQAKTRMQAAEAMQKFRAARLRRMQQLAAQGTTTEDELQEAMAAADQALRLLQEARLGYDIAVKGPREELVAQAAAQVAVQQEEINRIQDQINKHTIKSPFDGFIVEEHTQAGEWASRGGLIAKVVELAEVDVEVPVPEAYLRALRIGAPAQVEVPAVSSEPLTGTIAAIVPQADERARSFTVKIRLKNRVYGGRLDGQFVEDVRDQLDERPRVMFNAGMFARATLPVAAGTKATLVHKDSVVLGKQPIVYVMDPDAANPQQGTVRPVPVELGSADGSYIEVKAELQAGQQVVVRGNERLRPGTPVRVVSGVTDPQASN